MKAKRVFALLAAFGLTAAACGSSTDDASDTSTDVTEAMEETDSTEASGEVEPETPGEAAAEIATDYGVTDDVVRIGINADLSGPFASLVSEIVEGQKAYWEIYNAAGGLNGRTVETVILDSGYDTDTGIQNYKELAQESDDGVLMISENTGSPITAALAEDAIDDNMLLIPLSWASLWPDPVVGEAVLEKQTTYCIESMNHGSRPRSSPKATKQSLPSSAVLVSTAKTALRVHILPPKNSVSRLCTTEPALLPVTTAPPLFPSS